MANAPTTESIFFGQELDKPRVQSLIGDALAGADDGELFLEYAQTESLLWDDGRLRNASFDVTQGFGLRSVLGEASAYAHASEFSESALKRAAGTVRAVNHGQSGVAAAMPPSFGTNHSLYVPDNPIEAVAFERKLKLLADIDAYVRGKDPRVRQVSVSLAGHWQVVNILRADGSEAGDIRPLVRLNVTVVTEDNGKMESGTYGSGGRVTYEEFFSQDHWQKHADEALRQAIVKLAARPAPAGEMPVVLGSGWCGVILHEAVGHGLEGDFNRKKTSVFSELMGERVAAKGVTIVDDGTIENRRGSLSIDDEGTPTSRTVMIEDGILKGFIQDRLNARLMGMRATGNGRRESYSHAPMPRMTNTIMMNGGHTREEIISSVKDGLYVDAMGGGQVDITNGKFVFNVSEAYKIENGKLTYPVKGAVLIGAGSEVLKKVTMIGNDMAMDPGIGVCGKNGQGVPVGVGQPTFLVSGMTVGGTGA